MDQPVVGRIDYSPDFHSTPAINTIPAGITVIDGARQQVREKVAPDGTVCYIPLNAVEQTTAKKRVRKALEEFLEQLDELENSDVVRHSPGPARLSYLRNQRYFLLEAFEKKITDIFPKKSEPQQTEIPVCTLKS